MKQTYTIIFKSGRKLRFRASLVEVTKYPRGGWTIDYGDSDVLKLDPNDISAVLKGRH